MRVDLESPAPCRRWDARRGCWCPACNPDTTQDNSLRAVLPYMVKMKGSAVDGGEADEAAQPGAEATELDLIDAWLMSSTGLQSQESLVDLLDVDEFGSSTVVAPCRGVSMAYYSCSCPTHRSSPASDEVNTLAESLPVVVGRLLRLRDDLRSMPTIKDSSAEIDMIYAYLATAAGLDPEYGPVLGELLDAGATFDDASRVLHVTRQTTP